MTNVVTFEEHVNQIKARRQWIAVRRAELKKLIDVHQKEASDLYVEEQELEKAERIYQKYIGQ